MAGLLCVRANSAGAHCGRTVNAPPVAGPRHRSRRDPWPGSGRVPPNHPWTRPGPRPGALPGPPARRFAEAAPGRLAGRVRGGGETPAARRSNTPDSAPIRPRAAAGAGPRRESPTRPPGGACGGARGACNPPCAPVATGARRPFPRRGAGAARVLRACGRAPARALWPGSSPRFSMRTAWVGPLVVEPVGWGTPPPSIPAGGGRSGRRVAPPGLSYPGAIPPRGRHGRVYGAGDRGTGPGVGAARRTRTVAVAYSRACSRTRKGTRRGTTRRTRPNRPEPPRTARFTALRPAGSGTPPDPGPPWAPPPQGRRTVPVPPPHRARTGSEPAPNAPRTGVEPAVNKGRTDRTGGKNGAKSGRRATGPEALRTRPPLPPMS